MGIGFENAIAFSRAVKQNGLSGSLLQLGRQSVHITYKQFLRVLLRSGFASFTDGKLEFSHQFLDAFSGELCRKDIPSTEGDINDKVFFHSLGLEAFSCDVSDYENADYVVDLNQDVTATIGRTFDIVYNGGTIEHVFDVKAVMDNMHEMIRPGGFACHVAPVEGWVNHGYYQISPRMLIDYYAANSYELLESKYITCHDDECVLTECIGFATPPAGAQTHVFILAKKPDRHMEAVIPQQSFTYDSRGVDYAFAKMRHGKKLHDFVASNPNGRIAAWCGGEYAVEFLESNQDLAGSISFFVDSNKAKQQTMLLGKQVVSPMECVDRRDEIDAIAILTPESKSLYWLIWAYDALRSKTILD